MKRWITVALIAPAAIAVTVPLAVLATGGAAAMLSNQSSSCEPVAAPAAGGIVWPVPGRTVEQTAYNLGHNGVDINRGVGNDDLGDPIRAAAGGRVSYVGWGKGYGQAIFIATDFGVTNIYGHTSKVVVRAGDRVVAGQLIGNVGNTWKSGTIFAHLHFGVDPPLTHQAAIDFLNGKSTTPGGKPPAAQPPPAAPAGKWTAAQMTIARTAVAVGKANGIPERGWVAAIAGGLVESELRNLDYGDADSVGWLQQRPSSGWGTVAQIRDPALAAAAFYGVAKHTDNRGLVDVYQWETKPIGAVVQSVQVSRFPLRYQARVAEAQAIVKAVSGTPAAAAECTEPADDAVTGTAPTGTAPKGWPLLANHLGPNADRGRRLVTKVFGVPVSVPQCYDADGAGHVTDSYHYSGHACDVMIGTRAALGHRISRWAVANHKSLGVVEVIHNRQIWTVQRQAEGWRPYSGPSPHTGHVHLSFDRTR